MRRTLLVIGLALISNLQPVVAAEYDLPPGKWWEDQRLIDHIQLTAEQQNEIKNLVYEHARRMVDRNAQLEKAKLALENKVDQEPLDPDGVRRAFATFQEARRELETEHFEMLLSVRQVLSHEQWQELTSLRRRLDRLRQRTDRPHDGRPDGGRLPPRGPQRPGPGAR